MVMLLIADLDPEGSPFKQFIIVLTEAINKHPDTGPAKFAKFLKFIIEFIVNNSRFTMSMSASAYSIKYPITLFDLTLLVVIFAFTYYSKLTFLYIFGIAQINFLFSNSDSTGTRIIWMVFGMTVYIIGIERLLKYINE